MAEVVDEGVTGYLADDVPTAVAALARAVRLDRRAVHAHAAERFGVERMVTDYLSVYDTVLDQRAHHDHGGTPCRSTSLQPPASDGRC
jgi:hypothetical protein